VVGALFVVALVAAACQPPPPLGTVTRQSASRPQWPLLSDPAVMVDGGRYHVFGSAHAGRRIPVYTVDSLTKVYDWNEWVFSTREALPVAPPWAVDNGAFWAPTVARAANGYYVAFFAAQRINAPSFERRMCVGRALALHPGGPYYPDATPFSCGLDDATGAIDPSLFQGPNGAWYLHVSVTSSPGWVFTYALDANLEQARRPSGTACCHYEHLLYSPTQPWETTWIENVSMAYDPGSNTYLLAYSAGGSWTSPDYATGLARCSTPFGMCTASPSGPWLARSAGRTGTGGFSFFIDRDGSTRGVYSSFTAGGEPNGPRAATVVGVSFNDWNPTLTGLVG
jgi:hypothetical protein